MAAGRGSLYDNSCVFDSDTRAVGIDNRASGCISDDSDDFVGPLRECNRAIKGFGGTRTLGVKIGTLKWQWLDDDGMMHTFHIPNSFYVPQGKVKLLSPQHLAQSLKDTRPEEGTVSTTDSRQVVLKWAQRNYKLTVPLGKKDNVATFHLAPGISRFNAFCAEIGNEDADPIIANPAYISDDEGDDSDEPDENNISIFEGENGTQTHKSQDKNGNLNRQWQNTGENQPVNTDFDLNGPTPNVQRRPPTLIEDEEDRQSTNLAAELLRYHQ